ncbi:hypothetical protein H2248_005437 [Termitomyces sp. 'cryptogamus']|nr:hypothetical protein H2248_005437 [Termitomyces sp. 'cryptogamus']
MSPNKTTTRNLENFSEMLANSTTRDQLSPDIRRPVQEPKPRMSSSLRKTGGPRGQPDSPAQATERKKDKDKNTGWIHLLGTPSKTGGLRGPPDSPAQATKKEGENTKDPKGPKSTR